MICKKCGSLLKDDSKICENCGLSVDESNSENMNDVTVINKKKSKLPIIIVIIILFLALLACFCFFLINKKSNKDIFIDGIKSVTSKVFADDDFKQRKIESNMKFSIESNSEDLKSVSSIINGIDISSDISIDKSSNKMDENFVVNYAGGKALSLGLYSRDNDLYLLLDGLYNKYIKISLNGYGSLLNTNFDSKVIKNTIDDIFVHSLKESYFSSTTETIEINGKNKKVKAITLTIDKNNIKDILSLTFDSIKNNKELINMIAKNNGVDESLVKKYLEMIDFSNMDVESFSDKSLNITIYISGVKFTGLQIKTNLEEDLSLDIIKVNNRNYDLIFKQGLAQLKTNLKIEGNSFNKKITTSTDLAVLKLKTISTSKVTNNVSFKEFDTSNAISLEDYLELGLDETLDNLNSNETIIKLIQDITAAIGGSGSDLYSGNLF